MINWAEVHKELFPIKNYEDVCQRMRISFGYTFIHRAYNFTLPELVSYTHRLLQGDPRGRYEVYAGRLLEIIHKLQEARVADTVELVNRTASSELLELFTIQVEVTAPEAAMLLKYLVYWVVPSEKYLSGFVKDDQTIHAAILSLRENGIRTNLQLIQSSITHVDRQSLAEKTQVSLNTINELVNRADFSRLPWASKATISNIIGAGYASLAQLAKADPEKLYADFFRYGKSIGKNLRLGNEIENSYRIAKIVPVILIAIDNLDTPVISSSNMPAW
jgi:hypothetical protein